MICPERRVAILADKCISCAADVDAKLLFAEEKREYLISGMCSKCQEAFFDGEDLSGEEFEEA